MGKRPGNKLNIGSWVTQEMRKAIDEWLLKHPGASQSDFARQSYAEKLRGEGFKLDDSAVTRDDRVRVPGVSSTPKNQGIDVHALTKKKLAAKKARKQPV